MENKRQEPGLSGASGQTGEHDHKRIRSLSEEVPGMEPMLSDPGEPHKCIDQQSSRPGVKMKVSGQQQKPGAQGQYQLLGEENTSQKRPLLGDEDESQKHPLLGDETVSMENEEQERERRRIEAERTGQKKPAA